MVIGSYFFWICDIHSHKIPMIQQSKPYYLSIFSYSLGPREMSYMYFGEIP